ncbi:MAG: toxin-antitoxin system protein [Deltaproteobacteria bacterium]|nr:toxin-antitoxin system protein [Deltaproteobacteria bacterium]
MSTSTVRVTQSVRDVLRTLARDEGASMQAVLEKAIEDYRRQRLLKEANAAYLSLRKDPDAWSEELEERRSWEATLADDLEAE